MSRYNRLKRRVYEVLEVAKPDDKLSKAVDIILMSLILLNVALIIAGTFELHETAIQVFTVIENVSVAVFTVEYFLRLWTSDLKFTELSPFRARLRYIRTFAAVIDLVSLLPSFIPAMSSSFMVLRMFRVLRLLRVFKLNRYTHALKDIGEVFKRKAGQLISSMLVVSFLMIIAAVLMYDAEHEAQPEVFDNALSGMWWAIATLTTVGYGDIYPVTVVGKIMSAIIAILGIGLVAVPTGIISAGFTEQIERNRAEKESPEPADEKTFCPYCGHKLDK